MHTVIGIDLGTTNSCVATLTAEGPAVISNRGGYKTTPSMVAVTQAGKRLVGHIAKRQAITNAENTVYAAKRLIGRKWSNKLIPNAAESCAYELVEGPHDDVRVRLRDKTYSVPEISSMILQEMKIVADDYLETSVNKAVITVPAYFNDNQRQATKDAGTIAGLDVIRIINEPTAAALAYGRGRNLDQTVAVYDLGGGTFDVSILELGGQGVFRVVATTGDTYLGGEDFDARVLNWLVAEFQQEHGIDLKQDRMALQRLKDAAEKAKCELSQMTTTEVNLPFIMSAGRNEALHLQRTVTRELLEHLAEDLVSRTIDICRDALTDSGLEPDDIDEVLLVGGMTRMPAIKRAVTTFFKQRPNQGVHPDEAVAMGAAIQGAALVNQQSQEMLLLDVTPHALGLMTAGNHFEQLVAQNTTVPTSSTKVFTTSRDNQVAVKILVLQGESENAANNELLGEFVLTGLRKAKRGEVEVEVTFEIDTDGIVSVNAKDLETGQAQSIQVTASSGLTTDEIDDMIEGARDYLLERRASEESEEARQELERLMAQVKQLIPQVEGVVGDSEFGHDVLRKAKEVISRADASLTQGNVSQLRTEIETLQRTQRMFKGVVARA